MHILNLDQDTPQWLEKRQKCITATDVGIIIGVSPFKSPLELWEEKLGIRKPQEMTLRMLRGKNLEPIARQLLIEETSIDFKPIVAVHNTETWAMASLDGYCDSNHVICEIKASNLDTHQFALSGGLKPYYFSQVQWQLWVTGASQCYYFNYMPEHVEPTAIVEVFPDYKYIDSMIETCRRFYEENLCMFLPPEEPKKLELRKP